MFEEILQEQKNWQLSFSERASLLYLLDRIPNKNIAIEVGTYYGGSLYHLSKYFNKVYSCDINYSFVDKSKYKNVEWLQGNSKDTVPDLITELNNKKKVVNFILLDASHEYEPVYNDINNILKYIPLEDMVLLIHDSWYPSTRKAILDYKWEENPYIYYLNTDFGVGDIMMLNGKNTYVGGFCLALFSSRKRNMATEKLKILRSMNYMYESVTNIFK